MDWPSSTQAPPLLNGDLQSLFMADQQLFAQLGYMSTGEAAGAGRSEVPAGLSQQLGPAGAGPESRAPIGWGGQMIPDSAGFRVPWFGKRGKLPRQRPLSGRQGEAYTSGGRGDRDGSSSSSGQAPFLQHLGHHSMDPQQVQQRGMGGGGADDALSVEEAVALVRRLGRHEPLPERLFRALHRFDSRAVALLLKDLSKAGADHRAVELFDWLRNLPDRHLLRSLADVYTYTAMISLCIYQPNVDRALDLLEEMRVRGIERNVHTYTALMNVCIKCGKLSTALDIFRAMRGEDCTPNVVTYNTLIDVYGKLGQWDKAVTVLQLMRSEGVEPVLRTFNTLIIACNMCNQPREALGVYGEMLKDNFAPNSTTSNALISAYGKLGQLDRVLEVYREMVWKGLERSVITYSSLISACEKAGRWETALSLFDEMQRDGCTPNTVTYNSLITACGQGAQWEKAQTVFDTMQQQGCMPDVVTYTALISAFERGGQWQLTLPAFEQMCRQGCRPDAIVYNAIIDALWQTGVVWAQTRALSLYRAATKQGHFRAAGAQLPSPAQLASRGRLELNLHALTAGVAMLSLYSWLQDLRQSVLERGERVLPAMLAIVTDAGAASKEQSNFIIKEAVAATMAFWGAPFKPVQDKMYSGMLAGTGPAVAAWLVSDAFMAQVASVFTMACVSGPSGSGNSGAGASGSSALDDGALLAREYGARGQCQDAFAAVEAFERTHRLALQSMGAPYIHQRTTLVSSMLEHGSGLGLKDEVVHDGVLLMDRTLSCASGVPAELLPLVAGAALHLSAVQSEHMAAPTAAAVAERAGCSADGLSQMGWRIRELLGHDILAISAMRCVKVYLERLGYRYLDRQGVYALAGLPLMLIVESLFDMSLLNCRPSVVAAAVLYAERRQRGAVPFWPSALAKMTGYEDLTTPELACAVRTAQKLCRKVLYSQIYRQQAVGLAAEISGHGGAGVQGAGVQGSAGTLGLGQGLPGIGADFGGGLMGLMSGQGSAVQGPGVQGLDTGLSEAVAAASAAAGGAHSPGNTNAAFGAGSSSHGSPVRGHGFGSVGSGGSGIGSMASGAGHMAAGGNVAEQQQQQQQQLEQLLASMAQLSANSQAPVGSRAAHQALPLGGGTQQMSPGAQTQLPAGLHAQQPVGSPNMKQFLQSGAPLQMPHASDQELSAASVQQAVGGSGMPQFVPVGSSTQLSPGAPAQLPQGGNAQLSHGSSSSSSSNTQVSQSSQLSLDSSTQLSLASSSQLPGSVAGASSGSFESAASQHNQQQQQQQEQTAAAAGANNQSQV